VKSSTDMKLPNSARSLMPQPAQCCKCVQQQQHCHFAAKCCCQSEPRDLRQQQEGREDSRTGTAGDMSSASGVRWQHHSGQLLTTPSRCSAVRD
jgi:hypothetical protein